MSTSRNDAQPPRSLIARFEVPRAMRALVRARESSLIFLAAGVGALAGLVVAAMSLGVSELHWLLFGVSPTERLSAQSSLDPYLTGRDLRVLVGCGAAGAIAGAFGAPLGGAFYAFELVIASYSVASLAPVGLAALVGYLVANAVAPSSLGIGTIYVSHVTGRDLAIAAALGLVAGAAGIVLMRGV